MQHSAEHFSPSGVPRCGACDDVIGVYEPLVQVFAGRARQTSRAAEPGIECSGESCYHLGCYLAPEDEL